MSVRKRRSTLSRSVDVHFFPFSITRKFRYAKSCLRHASVKSKLRPVLPTTGAEHPSVVQLRRASRSGEFAVVMNSVSETENVRRDVTWYALGNRAASTSGDDMTIHRPEMATSVRRKRFMRPSFVLSWCVRGATCCGTSYDKSFYERILCLIDLRSNTLSNRSTNEFPATG